MHLRSSKMSKVSKSKHRQNEAKTVSIEEDEQVSAFEITICCDNNLYVTNHYLLEIERSNVATKLFPAFISSSMCIIKLVTRKKIQEKSKQKAKLQMKMQQKSIQKFKEIVF